MENKFKIGDKVEIINYGHMIWQSKNSDPELEELKNYPVIKENKTIRCLDMLPNIIGQSGIIRNISNSQNIPTYAISGIKGKSAWFDEEQLKLINKN